MKSSRIWALGSSRGGKVREFMIFQVDFGQTIRVQEKFANLQNSQIPEIRELFLHANISCSTALIC